MCNNSFIASPIGERVIIKPKTRQEKTDGGIILPDCAKEKPQEGEVVSIGKGRQTENGQFIPIELKIGDKVLYGKYSGTEIKIDGEEYLILKETEIFAKYIN